MTLALQRGRRRPVPLSIVPMIDVLLILLIFFMVTSTYLDLDMLPASSRPEGTGASAPASAALLIRLDAGGGMHLGGRPVAAAEIGRIVAERVSAGSPPQVMILPSPRAPLQSLIGAMDIATAAGAASVGILRFEAGAP